MESNTGPTDTPCVVLWHRTGRRGKWREIGSAPTQAQALALIDKAGKVGGDWIVKPRGQNPNDVATV